MHIAKKNTRSFDSDNYTYISCKIDKDLDKELKLFAKYNRRTKPSYAGILLEEAIKALLQKKEEPNLLS